MTIEGKSFFFDRWGIINCTVNPCFVNSDMIKCAISDDKTYPGPFAYAGYTSSGHSCLVGSSINNMQTNYQISKVKRSVKRKLTLKLKIHSES